MPNWTNKQKQVIETRDKNILVSAAAGSGKTAVLVERIIQKVLDEEHPLDIDKILVMTFTNAAAAEMRERVLQAISEALEKNPENEHLQRQQTFIHNAHITTIHSFCLNLVREHFNDTDLDPGVRVADANEIELMKSDVIKEVMEEFYTKHEENFIRFVSLFEKKSNDASVHDMIQKLYHKAMGYPQPQKWLESCIDIYDYQNMTELEQDTIYMPVLKRYTDSILEEYIGMYQMMLYLCATGGPLVYQECLEEELSYLQSALADETYNGRRNKLNMEFRKLPTCRKGTCDTDKKEQVTLLRNSIKDGIAKLKSKLYSNSLEINLQHMKQCKEMMEVYVTLTLRFIERFGEVKHEKNVIDFNDFEHYAISILMKEDEEGNLVPTKTADEFAKEFEEVMVDEYQDSNLVQETILSAVSKGRFGVQNRFMVGDVKQSIYGFRGADPGIFVAKSAEYKEEGTDGNIKIILDQNFRSRQGVIDSTNFIFHQIMGKEFGDIDYSKEALNFGAVLPEPDDNTVGRIDDKTELLMIKTQADEKKKYTDSEDDELDVASNEIQAKVLADRIESLIDTMMVFDKNEKTYRKLKYSDIAILSRSCDENTETISEEFARRGIPVSIESKEGYFKTTEIKTLVSLLKVIDNPRQDIPLAEVLKAPFVNLEDNELAAVRAFGGKNKSLYENMQFYLKAAGELSEEEKLELPEIEYDELIGEKLRAFVELLDDCREQVAYMTIYEIICYILEKTRYEYYASTMSSSQKRIANIELLKTKAKEYEKGSYKGLFNFIRYVDKIKTYDVKTGEAQIVNDSFEAVKIMTIHKSKGLEFPVVFIINLGKRFNMKDAQGKNVIHAKLGVGLDYIDEETKVRSRNIIKSAIAKQSELDVIQEEMRLFYVACTRAKDKLIFVAPNVSEDMLKKLISYKDRKDKYFGYGVASMYKSYLDFVLSSLARNKAMNDIYSEVLKIDTPTGSPIYQDDSNIEVRYMIMTELFEKAIEHEVEEKNNLVRLTEIDDAVVYNNSVKEALEKQFQFVYEYNREVLRHAKFSVSEIKKISHETADEGVLETTLNIGNEYIQESQYQEEQESVNKKILGASRGTIYHKFFEHLDYSQEAEYQNIQMMIENLVQQKQITREEADVIFIKDFVTYGKTDLYQRMKRAALEGKLYREQQFVVGFTESEIENYEKKKKKTGETGVIEKLSEVEKEGDIVLIQGVIDAYFVEDDKICIVDYKTDSVNDESQLEKNYYIQLKLYADALSKITGMSVEQMIIYSTKLGKEIKLI